MFSFWDAFRAARNDVKGTEELLDKNPEVIKAKCEAAETCAAQLRNLLPRILDHGLLGMLASGLIELGVGMEEGMHEFQGLNRYRNLTLLEVAAASNATQVGLMLVRRGAELTEKVTRWGGNDFLRTLAYYYEYQYKYDPTGDYHLSQALLCYLGLKSRPDIKRLERKIFATRYGKYHTTPGTMQTALHRAALFGFTRQYLTLLHLDEGASVYLQDVHGKKPGEYLTETQKDKINNTRLNYQELHLPTVDAIMRAIVFTQAINTDSLKLALENIYQLPAIKPLMDLAKFAALGQHRLSGRFSKNEVDAEYDSDDEAPIESKHCLSISLDSRHDNIFRMYVSGKDGLGMSAYGLCCAWSNRLYAGIDRPIADYIGSIIHEICHYVAWEVFYNSANPYHTDDNKNRFRAIADELAKSVNELPEELQMPFDVNYYKPDSIDKELIVRVAQIIVSGHMNGKDGIAELKARPDTSQLYDYYEQIFLPAVTTHVEKLTTRAFHHWDPEIFKCK